jgi:hypothetical protein
MLTKVPKMAANAGILTYFVPTRALTAGKTMVARHMSNISVWSEKAPSEKAGVKSEISISLDKMINMPPKKNTAMESHTVVISSNFLIV